MHDLTRRGLIKAGRGEIIVLDRAGLDELPMISTACPSRNTAALSASIKSSVRIRTD